MMVPKSQDFEQHGGVCIVCGRRTKKKKEKEGKGGRVARLILENSGGARAAVSRERPDCGRLANDRRRDSEEWPVRPHHLFFFFLWEWSWSVPPQPSSFIVVPEPPTSEGTWEQRGRLGNSRHFSVRRDRMGWVGGKQKRQQSSSSTRIGSLSSGSKPTIPPLLSPPAPARPLTARRRPRRAFHIRLRQRKGVFLPPPSCRLAAAPDANLRANASSSD